MKRKKLSPMRMDELEKLPTKRLIARLRQLQRCENSLDLTDQIVTEYEPSGRIEFKDSADWITEYKKMKEILSRREHIPSKK